MNVEMTLVVEEDLKFFVEVKFKIRVSPSYNLRHLCVIEYDKGKVNVARRSARKYDHLN